MLLCSSSGVGGLLGGGLRRLEGEVDLAGDVAFEAADDLFAGALAGSVAEASASV
jgi:hypothetical protein